MMPGTAQTQIWWARPLLCLASCCCCLHCILSLDGLGSADSIHLQQAVVAFNSQVSLPNAISVNSALASPTPIQKVLSGMIEDYLFSIMLESSSPTNRTQLLSVAAPHSSSWLSMVPSTGLGLWNEFIDLCCRAT